jgi:hypothetical protein
LEERDGFWEEKTPPKAFYAARGGAGGGEGVQPQRGARGEGGNGPGAAVLGGRRAHDTPRREGEARRWQVGRPRKERSGPSLDEQ